MCLKACTSCSLSLSLSNSFSLSLEAKADVGLLEYCCSLSDPSLAVNGATSMLS